jgi:lysophospholipase L1-like esterase
MPTLANNDNVTLTLTDYDSVTISTLGVASVSAVSGLGVAAGKIAEFSGSRTLGPFTAGSLSIAASVRPCHYEVADGVRPVEQSGAGAVAAITGSYVVGQTLTATFPAGITGTIQFTRTLAAAPFTKTAISGAVASAVNSLTYTVQSADTGYVLGVDCTTVQSGIGGVVGTNNAAQTLRQVATGTHLPNALATGSLTTSFSRTPHIMMGAVASLAIVLPNWYVNGQTEANAGSTTWTAAIEYPAGTFTRVTFAGADSVTSAAGGNIVSDQMPVAIPKGDKFWVRLFQNAPGKVVYSTFYAGDGTAQFTSPATDMTMGGTVTTAVSKDAPMTVPIAIIGMSSDPAIGIYGDSISVGRGDTADVNLPLQGHLGRAFGGSYAAGHVGISGDRMSTFLAGNSKRMSLAQYFTHFAINMGINDITGGGSTASVASDTNAVVALFAPKPVALCTLSPVTTSTDTWNTTGNQTPAATNGNRITENTRRLAGVPGAKVIYDVNPAVETVASPESGIWKAPSFTADGTHPAATGYKAEAAAINVTLLTA